MDGRNPDMFEPPKKAADCPQCKKGCMQNIYHNFDGDKFRCDTCGHEVYQRDPFDSML